MFIGKKNRSADEESRIGSRKALLTALGLIALLGAAAGLFWFGSGWIYGSGPQRFALAPVGISFVLAAVPVMICLVQEKTKQRSLRKLESLNRHPVYATEYCQAARKSFEAINSASLGGDYILPMLTFLAVTTISCLIASCALLVEPLFTTKVPLLGGLRLTEQVPLDQLAQYQEGTFIVGCMAFFGSYVYMLGRLLDRVGNNDLAPISLHYYAARIIIATLTAAVFRHTAYLFGVERTELLVLLGFVTGLAPDLFIIAMARRGFQAIKVFGSKNDPDEQYRPAAMPLLMITDLTKEKVDRLNELGIDSAQVLACQNPFTLWPKLPYDLGLLLDWIAAAQLYTLLDAKRLRAARERLVVDIFDLSHRLSDTASRGALCSALGIDPPEADIVVQQLESDQSFTRLRQVKDALVVAAGAHRGRPVTMVPRAVDALEPAE